MPNHEKKRRKKHRKDSSSDDNNQHYEYDQLEVVRLTGELLSKNFSFEKEMLQIYKKLDRKDIIALDGLEDANLKKKLRHIFKALRLDKKLINGNEGFRKPKDCKASLVQIYKSILADTKPFLNRPKHLSESSSQITPTALTENSVLHPLNSSECIEDKTKRKRDHWMTDQPSTLESLFTSKIPKTELKDLNKNNSQELKDYIEEYNKQFRSQSLLDMHRQGYFKGQNKEQQEYIKTHQLGGSDPYKKSSKKGSSRISDGTPWRAFDRETDLEVKKQVQSQDFHRLLDQSDELYQRFEQPQFQSSFL